ncbi:hypothetical protein AB7M49_007009 [Bradyrhizobium elkanii]
MTEPTIEEIDRCIETLERSEQRWAANAPYRRFLEAELFCLREVRGRLVGVAQGDRKPLAWRFEAATFRIWKDGVPVGWDGWEWKTTELEPNMGGAMRNVTPLYALSPNDPPQMVCAAGVDPGWDNCQKCGASMDDDCRGAALPEGQGKSPLQAPEGFRVVPVRVLQSAYDRIDAMLASSEPDLRAANSVRIELRHLINETYALPSNSGGVA